MLTYQLEKAPGIPLYEALYRCIREDILQGKLLPGEKLPSKRALASHLEVSKITVEGAYSQLLAEGYIRSREKVGYFVEAVEHPAQKAAPAVFSPSTPQPSAPGGASFPFSVWTRLQREVILDMGQQLLLPLPNRGAYELRWAIAEHLAQFRGMRVDPENILVGSGTDFLYNLLIQLLGRELLYAVEEPGYGKIPRLYAAAGARCISAGMDRQGVQPQGLDAQVLHLSPSHHFPTGIITSLPRRQELLRWASAQPGRWIIEDDYDSEFRFNAHPMPTVYSLDPKGRVIYMNTFSKTLSPSIRISYAVLPGELMQRFQQQLGFYSGTVASFEQYTLARFLKEGHFEKHINRMRKTYRSLRNRLLDTIQKSPLAIRLQIAEEHAGLHFLLTADTPALRETLLQSCAGLSLQLQPLENFYHGNAPASAAKTLLVGYATLREEELPTLGAILEGLSRE